MINPLFPTDNLAGKLTSKCPVCGSNRDFMDMTVLDDSGDGHLVHIKCSKCLTNLVGLINIGPMGVSVVSFATDLEKMEIVGFKDGDFVSEDDIIELHETLESEKNNFIEIIK